MGHEALHRQLHAFNGWRHEPRVDDGDWQHCLGEELEHRALEIRFVECERTLVRRRAAEAPRDPERFVAWFESLAAAGPGQGDPLFPWLAREASLDDMRWFLFQEMAGEAGFDDLVALTQVKLPAQPKLELARNYWDEMGRGKRGGMHGPMLERLAQELALDDLATPVWESLALSNTMIALAANRQYAYQSIGALGVIELTAPGRAALVNEGLVRLGVCGEARRYYALHATLDVKHSLAWNREVLAPLVAADPRTAAPIAEGALLRLAAGARCFARYRSELWGQPCERAA
ncbi:MAG TPA: iron-containing redox enzyme family protein [Nannocystaceae bacterium]|nr:iron-containing redox enzyme family protein [Nannocystaceae bacterium]